MALPQPTSTPFEQQAQNAQAVPASSLVPSTPASPGSSSLQVAGTYDDAGAYTPNVPFAPEAQAPTKAASITSSGTTPTKPATPEKPTAPEAPTDTTTASETPAAPTTPKGNITVTADDLNQYVIDNTTGNIVSGPSYGRYRVGTNVSDYGNSIYLKALAQGKTDAEAKLAQDNYDTTVSDANLSAAASRRDKLVQGYTDGSIPLTASEQAQLDALKSDWQNTINQQAEINKAATGAATMSGVRFGRVYDQSFDGNMQQVLSAGLQKINAYTTQMLGALETLKTAMKDKDIAAARAAYEDVAKTEKDRKESIQKSIEQANAVIKEQQEKVKAAQKQQYDEVTKPIEDIAKEAAKNGADKLTQAKIAAAKTVKEAIQAAGAYLETGSGIVAEYLKYVRDAQKKNVPYVDFETYQTRDANRKATTKGVDAGATGGVAAGTTGVSYINKTIPGYTNKIIPGTGGLTQSAIDQAGLTFALTGIMPSIGLGSTGMAMQKRDAIMNRAAELDAGGNIQNNKAQVKALAGSLDKQVEYANQVERSLKSAEEGMNQVVDTFKAKKINAYDTTLANIISNATKYQLNPEDISAFNAGLVEVGNEYQQVFSRGGQVSDKVRAQAEKITNGDISLTALQAIGKELQAQGKIVIDNANRQVAQIQDDLNNVIKTDAPITTADHLIASEQQAQSVMDRWHMLHTDANSIAQFNKDLDSYLQATGHEATSTKDFLGMFHQYMQ